MCGATTPAQACGGGTSVSYGGTDANVEVRMQGGGPAEVQRAVERALANKVTAAGATRVGER